MHPAMAARAARPLLSSTSDLPDAPRVLFYSHDGFGLGHLQRNLKIATRLLRDLPGASAVLVAGMPGTPGLDLPPGVDLVKLPSIRKVTTDCWEARQLRIDLARLRQLRAGILEATFASFVPHLVVVDYLPLGVWGELRAPLERLREERPQSAFVLGLRDVLDSPLITRRTWRTDGHDDAVRELYDAIHVYGDPQLYDTGRAYALDELAPGRVAYTGYVCGDPPLGDVASERDRLGLMAGEELVLVTAGGGADAFPMMRLAVRGIRRLTERGRRVRALVVTGPLMVAGEVAELERLAIGCPITVQRWKADLATTMAAAGAIVTMGAYNTLTEATLLGRAVISIPRPGPSAEQTTRARLFAARGLLHDLPQDASPNDVARALAAALSQAPGRRRPPAMDGLENATKRLHGMLSRATATSRQARHGGGRLA